MRSLMEKRDSLSVVNDQVGSPTYAADLAEAILTIVNHKKWTAGLYHYSNEGEISRFDFANNINFLVILEFKLVKYKLKNTQRLQNDQNIQC